jgi:hypothetical protein
MENIKWYNLNHEGYIINNNNCIVHPIHGKGGVYVYKSIQNNIDYLYIGSSINIKNRFRQHRYRCSSDKFKYNNLFYNYIHRYGWNEMKFGVLSYIDINCETNWQEGRNTLLKMEQKYLNQYSPNLNIRQNAGKIWQLKRKLCNNASSIITINKKSKFKFSDETLLKIKLHNKDITVTIYNKEGNIIKQFNRITAAANFIGLSRSSLSNYIKNNKIWKDKYYFKLTSHSTLSKQETIFPLDFKDLNIIPSININNKRNKSYSLGVLSLDNKFLLKYNSLREASLSLNISKITLAKYAMENKIWKNKYIFQIIN